MAVTVGNYKLADSGVKDNDIPEGEKYGNNASWGTVNWRWVGGGGEGGRGEAEGGSERGI